MPAASGNGGAPATSKAAKKKAGTPKASSPKKADDLRPESLSLGSAMDFPSLPGTPTAGRTASKTSEPEDAPAITKPEGMDDSIEAAEPVPEPAPAPAAAGGWAQVAKKGTPRAAGDAPAVKVLVPAAEPALSQQGQEGGAGGGVAKAESGIRPDGVRGLMASEDLQDGEVAVWLPNEMVLSEDTADPAIAKSVDQAIRATMQETPMSNAEANVYRTMGCLVGGYMLEKARGENAKFATYCASLPEPPDTFNTWPQVRACVHARGCCRCEKNAGIIVHVKMMQ